MGRAPLLALALGSLLCLAFNTAASPLSGWRMEGDAVMRWMGLKVYRIRYFLPAESPREDPSFALELEYAMRFKGADIAARSIEEMRAQGWNDRRQLAKWERTMQRIFPDVRPGDRLTGIALPSRAARFYQGERLLGTVEDPEFVQAFFDIWLSPRTRAPRVRAQLLGVR